MNNQFIFEVPVFDGRTKEWRILNLNTGTIYSGTNKTENTALAAINQDEKRGNMTVKRVRLSWLFRIFNAASQSIFD